MLDGPLLSAEEFLETRYELPESGQWAELEAGRVSLLQPPDLDYGNTVLNLSKALADYIQTHQLGYACFDLGMLMETEPDTIRYPAVCYFLSGPRFAETDKFYTERIPAVIMELTSTSDRREKGAARAQAYLEWGVQSVWLIDPSPRHVRVSDQSGRQQLYEEADTLRLPDLLPHFACEVRTLFTEPQWWSA